MNVYEEHKEVLRITLRRVLLLYLNEKKLIFFFIIQMSSCLEKDKFPTLVLV